MQVTPMREWSTPFGCPASEQDEGRAELARLGLIAHPYDRYRLAGDPSTRRAGSVGHRGRATVRGEGSSPSRPSPTAARLAVLLGAVMVASLAALFG